MIMSFKFYRIYPVLAALFFIIILYGISVVMVKEPTLNVNASCELNQTTNLKCTYVCQFVIDCEGLNINARIIATHFNWVAIYDNRTVFECQTPNLISIDLPVRDYTYGLRATFYNIQNKYGTYAQTLYC